MLFDPERGEVLGSDYIPEENNNFHGKTLTDPTTEEIMYEIPFSNFAYATWDFAGGDPVTLGNKDLCVLSDIINNEDRSTSWSGTVDFTIDKYTSEDGYILHIYKYYPLAFRTEFESISGNSVNGFDIWLVHDSEVMSIAANDSDAEAFVRYKWPWEVCVNFPTIEDIHDRRSDINDALKYLILDAGQDSGFDGFNTAWGKISNIVIVEEDGNHYVDSYDYEPSNLLSKYTLISRCHCSPHFRVTRTSTSTDEFTGGDFPVNLVNYFPLTTVGTVPAKDYIKFYEEYYFCETEVAHDEYKNWAYLLLGEYDHGFNHSTLQPSNGYSSRILQLIPYSLNAIDKLNEKVDNVIEGVEETFEHFQEEIDDIMSDVTNTISNLYVSR